MKDGPGWYKRRRWVEIANEELVKVGCHRGGPSLVQSDGEADGDQAACAALGWWYVQSCG